jgi:hypothetical protein
MTSNVLPVPYVAVAESELSAENRAYKAFDGLHSDTAWASTGMPTWLQVGIGNAQVACRYGIRAASANYPTDWTFLGSNNGVDWTLLDTQVDQTLQFYVDWYTNIDNDTAYKYYMWDITGTSGTIIVVGEFRIYTTSIIKDPVHSGIVSFPR